MVYGFLKFDTVQTTETIVDSNGVNLAGQTVTWNDPATQTGRTIYKNIKCNSFKTGLLVSQIVQVL